MMSPERWVEIHNAPPTDWWGCSDWIKGAVKDLMAEVRRLRNIEQEASSWYERWAELRDRFASLQMEFERVKLENAEIQRREEARYPGADRGVH